MNGSRMYRLAMINGTVKRSDLYEKLSDLPNLTYPGCDTDHGLLYAERETKFTLNGQLVATIIVEK